MGLQSPRQHSSPPPADFVARQRWPLFAAGLALLLFFSLDSAPSFVGGAFGQLRVGVSARGALSPAAFAASKSKLLDAKAAGLVDAKEAAEQLALLTARLDLGLEEQQQPAAAAAGAPLANAPALAADAAAARAVGASGARLPLADGVVSGAALARTLGLVAPPRNAEDATAGAAAALGVWRMAPMRSGSEGEGSLAGVAFFVRAAPHSPFGDAARVFVEDGGLADRKAAAALVLRALKECGDGGVGIIAPTADDLLQRRGAPARAEAYGIGDAIFAVDLEDAAGSPYELAHALLDLMHCVDDSKHQWTAFQDVKQENKRLWALAQMVESVDVFPGGLVVSNRFGGEPPRPPPPLLPFEETARALAVVPDKVSSHTYSYSYELHFGRVRAAALARGGAVRLLEIGLGCDMTYGEGAGFPLWRAYFGEEGGGVELSVLEFQKECALAWGARKENSDVTVYVGDQRDRELLRRIIAERGPFDVVIDDGAHSMQGQTAAIEVFFPEGLRPGGVLAIEDLFTSHSMPQHWQDGPPRTVGLFAEIAEALVARGPQFADSVRADLAGRRGARASVDGIVDKLAHLQCSAELCVLVRKE